MKKFPRGASFAFLFVAFAWTGVGTTGSTSPKGALAGVTLGYNLQTGSWVWGIEGDFDYSWVKGSAIGTGACAAPGCETRNSWLATGRGRIGYAGWDRWLPYFTGGAAYGQVKMTPAAGAVESKNRLGWTLGGGVEYAVMSNWTAKLEYLYVDLGTSNCSGCARNAATGGVCGSRNV